MSTEVTPQIKTQTLTLELQDPTLPPVFYAQLTTLRDSILVNVGAGPPVAALPFSIAQDFSCAMPVSRRGPRSPHRYSLTLAFEQRPSGPAVATSLSRSAQSSSLALSTKLCEQPLRHVAYLPAPELTWDVWHVTFHTQRDDTSVRCSYL